ncbi:hypothetical protein H4R24_000949 [Coemansia sp. RSA 988]|nr:hypothetical protein H4R24_000949 [Coemansia sp. RSA 988]
MQNYAATAVATGGRDSRDLSADGANLDSLRRRRGWGVWRMRMLADAHGADDANPDVVSEESLALHQPVFGEGQKADWRCADSAAMTTHPMDHPPSDIDVDLSSEEGHVDESEASQLLRTSKVYDLGSNAHAANPRRMDFSPTPSPPPADATTAQAPVYNGAHVLAPSSVSAAYGGGPVSGSSTSAGSSTAVYPAPVITHTTNGRDDHSELGSAKEGSVESSVVHNPASPAVAHSGGGNAGTSTTPAARSRTSIWVHFTRDPDYATNRRGRCVYCHNYYSCSSGSTGNMWRHIKRSHPEKATHAAPLATHGLQTTPQSKAETTPSAYDSRSRKRQASLSSPISDHFGTPARPGTQGYGQQSQQQQSQQPQSQQLSQQQSQQRLSVDSATRSLEEALSNELGSASHGAATDADSTSADSLVHALQLLLTLSGRGRASTAERPTAQAHPSSSASLLAGLLDSLSAARNAPESGTSAGDGSRLSRHVLLPNRTSSALAPIPEGHYTVENVCGIADAGLPGPTSYYDNRRGHANPDSINHFVSAISDAIRSNADADLREPGARAQKTLRAYVDFMVRDLVPVDKMLSPGMQQLMASMSPRDAPVPTPAALVDEIHRRQEARSQQLHQRLDAVRGKVSISISSGRVAGPAHYVAVHAHWVDEAIVRHDELLSWTCVDGPATSGDIMLAFESTLMRYGLFGRLGAVTTNYTREFVEFLNQVETVCHARGASFDLDRNQSTCIASALLDAQSKLLGMLYDAETPGVSGSASQTLEVTAASTAGAAAELRTPLAKLRTSMGNMLAPGGTGSQQLVELCRSREIELSTLAFDKSRPWDSTAMLLDSSLAIYSDLSAIMNSLPPSENSTALTAEDWLWLSQARALMYIVGVGIDALTHLPEEFPSIVDVVPVYDALVENLQSFLQTPSLCEGVRRAGEALRDYLAQCHPFQASPIYRLAPLFDPRLKADYYSDRGYDQAWISRVMREAKSLLSEYAAPSSAPADAESADMQSPLFMQLASSSQSGDIRTAIDSFVQLSKPATASQLAADSKARLFRRAFASGRTEFEDYMDAPLAAPSVTAIPWWRIHGAAYPGLAKLAREYLSIPASCCGTSSIFKQNGASDYSQVADLDKKLASAYVCLHHWQQKNKD